jgi:hypothetical protein
MADEESTAPEGVEDEELATETESPEEEALEPAADGDEETDGEDDDAEEEVEYDFGGGQKVRFPANATAKEVMEAAQKAFKDVEGNYTRKSQSVAEQAKAIEADRTAVEMLRNLNGAALEEYSRGLSVKKELEQLQRYDINALWQSKPDQARRVSDLLSQKQAQFQQIVNRVAQIESEQAQTEVAEVTRRSEEGKREVERRIPGFAEKHASELVKYAVSKGIPEGEAGNWSRNPTVTEMAFKAMQYDAMQAKAKAATKPRPATATPVPASRSKGGSHRLDLNKDADKMSADEWARRRNAELRAS